MRVSEATTSSLISDGFHCPPHTSSTNLQVGPDGLSNLTRVIPRKRLIIRLSDSSEGTIYDYLVYEQNRAPVKQ